MSRVHITTPGRLHFGLLGWGPNAPRQFGGVGLMIERPGIELVAEPGPRWEAEGPLAGRVLDVAERVAEGLARRGVSVPTARLRVVRAPAEHAGLGVGTQLSLAVARALAELAGHRDLTTATLAELTGRGRRSGIGLHGFRHGGLIVDGGHREAGGVPPLLARLAVPREWKVLVVTPGGWPGLHGAREARAFEELPTPPEVVSDRLCRLVLLGLMPAVVERDLDAFGAALEELQDEVGRCFAPAQGGAFARPESEAIVAWLRSEGLRGVGQSSWGPTLYGFSDEPLERRSAVLGGLKARFGLGDASWTEASGAGARLVVDP
jgi:beta-RFAP synthase